MKFKVGDDVICYKPNPLFPSYPKLGSVGKVTAINEEAPLIYQVTWENRDITDLEEFELRLISKLDKALK